MDIALQLSFLLHPHWHYITTLCNNGIVITEREEFSFEAQYLVIDQPTMRMSNC